MYNKQLTNLAMRLTSNPKEASSLDEAINQFYENPNRYPNNAVAGRPDPRVQSDVTDAQALPPSYDSHISSVHRAEHAPHKNIVTEAGDVRARDEVRLERQNMCDPSNIPGYLARDAKHAFGHSNKMPNLQYRH